MKSKILLSTFLVFAAFGGFAQQSSNKAFAITGDGNNDFLWMNIREINLGTGKVEKTLFERTTSSYTLTNVKAKTSVDAKAITDGNVFYSEKYPTGTFVAAAAYDQRSGNLFFMPMRLGELRWVNVNNGEASKFYSVKTELVMPPSDMREEAGNITRMTIAANGKGYALSNDGNNLLEFTTSTSPKIRSLGALHDAETSAGISIHEKLASWGGDMVADAYGKLWVVSAGRQVFEIDPVSMQANYKGPITGIPANFTTNGAAVDAEGNIVVTSAIIFDGYYKVNPKTLEAMKIEGSDVKYNASDLAGSNLLFQNEKNAANKFGAAAVVTDVAINPLTSVFPNPVTDNNFKVQLDAKAEGNYNIIITDLSGRSLQMQKSNLLQGQRLINVNLATRPAAGSYLIKVVNAKGQVVLTDKLIIK